MQDRELAQAYAKAVYDLALEGWIGDLAAVRDSLRADWSVRVTLGDETVAFGTRQALADRLLPPGASDQLKNFVYSLVGEGHLDELDDIIAELRRMARHGLGVRVAQVTSAGSLASAERGAIEKRLIARYGRDIDITWRQDPALMGGLVIRMGDEVIDDSLAARLESLKRSLKESI